MNKKIISILGAAALTLSLVVGGVIMTGIQTVASGTQIVLSVDSPVVESDEEIKVAVTASSGEAMSYIKAKLSYDSEVLELVEASSDKVSGINGEVHIYETLAYGENERTYELTFKALEVGSASISVEEGTIELYESLEQIQVSESTLEIESIVNESLSSDARLSEMAVIGIRNIDTFFDPDVFEYDLEVGVSTKKFIYSATPMNRASIVVAPENLMLEIGENYFEILVTAPSGDEQIYKFNITRLEEELPLETEATETVAETEIETEEAVTETEILVDETVEDDELLATEMLDEEETLDAQAIEVVE